MSDARFEAELRARWLSKPSLSLSVARVVWGDHPWPELVRYRVISFPGDEHRPYIVAHVCHSLADARRYVAQLRRLGIARDGPYLRRDVRIRRSKLAPSHVLVKTRIPVLKQWYEPPMVVDMTALLLAPSGRVTAYYQSGDERRFSSLRRCLAFFHRDLRWLSRREALHLDGA